MDGCSAYSPEFQEYLESIDEDTFNPYDDEMDER